MWKPIVVAFATLAFCGLAASDPAAAQSAADAKVCTNPNAAPEATIAACSRIIASRKLKPAQIANAYIWRSKAYLKKKLYDQVIGDATEAIRLDPKNIVAYNERGLGYGLKGDLDRSIADFSEAIRINPKDAASQRNRGIAHSRKSDFDRAVADLTEAIRLDPGQASTYNHRGYSYAARGDYERALLDLDEAVRIAQDATAYISRAKIFTLKGDHTRAMADFDEAIRRDSKSALAYIERAIAHQNLGDLDRSIADSTEAIRLDPTSVVAYGNRAFVFIRTRQYERAIADTTEALRINPNVAGLYANRGAAYSGKGDHDRALRDLDEAARLAPKEPRIFLRRAQAYRAKGDLDQANRDIAVALSLKPADADAIQERDTIRRLTAEAERKSYPGAPPVSAPVTSGLSGPRVALVIGNGKYRSVPELANPANDARDVASTLRELGFRVIEGYDLDGAGLRAKIGEFGSVMTGAGTTLFFYAGHGIQVAGQNYLIPVDAMLERPSALDVEAVRVETILADMETEKRINLVFLDACRDNPMSRSLAQAFGAGRSASVGQGLAQLNAGIGTLITFATSPNKVALDGVGRNSPFTAALLKHIRTPDLEVRTLLTRVRADVIRETNERQVPWDHSSLTGEFFFKRGG